MVRAQQNSRRGFTLIELLVVIAILVILIAVLIPSLAGARETARRSACLSNLHELGVAIYSYASENGNSIPYGPKAPPMMSASDFYPSTGAPTSLISLMNGAPVGMGLMLADQLAKQPKVLFCPGSDQPFDADAELASVGIHQAQTSYYYRHGSSPLQFDPPVLVKPAHIRIENLGENRNGRQIRALAVDTQFVCPPDFAAFGVISRTHHGQKVSNILFSDGHAATASNAARRFTVDLSDYAALLNAFDVILKVLERADEEM